MGKTLPGSVKETGAPANAILVGMKNLNSNLQVRVHREQPKGDGGRIVGSFDFVNAGDGTYAKYLKDFEGRSFVNVGEFFAELNAKGGGALNATHILNRNNLKLFS